MYKCCIFDLDGTLINSIEAIVYSCNLALKELKFPEVGIDEYKLYVGDGVKKMVERLLKKVGDSELEYFEELRQLFEEYFAQYYLHEVKVYDGVIKILDDLKKRGIKLAIFSNKPHARTVDTIDNIFGKQYFDFVQGEAEDAGLKKKPNPDGVYLILNKLEMNIEDCLYIGDTNTDMTTGKNAGVDTVGVTWGFRTCEELELCNPTYLINSPRELLNIVK